MHSVDACSREQVMATLKAAGMSIFSKYAFLAPALIVCSMLLHPTAQQQLEDATKFEPRTAGACMVEVEGNVSVLSPLKATRFEKRNERLVIGERIAETGFYQSIEVSGGAALYSKMSKYQHMEVYDSDHYGRILVLDGVVQLTERDADSYNEMMAHVAMFAHPRPRRVLVIGGGDGYVLREVLKHSSVEEVHHVDLDGEVVDVCKKFFPWGDAWEDPRVTLHVADGAAFARDAPDGYYDVIVQDSSDPFTWEEDGGKQVLPSSILYSEDHFKNLSRILKSDGVLNIQGESFQIPSDLEGIYEWRQQALQVGFESASYGSINISSYPTGQIGFMLCKKNKAEVPMEDIQRRHQEMQETKEETTYYQPKLQRSTFDLPLWVEKSVYKESTPLN